MKRFIGIICMIAAVFVTVCLLEEFVTKRFDLESLELIGYYAEDKDTIDVVVMGASEVTQGFHAPEFYRSFGLTAAPYAFTINPVPLWKYELRDIERTQNPELLVIEINGVLYAEDEYISRHGSSVRLLESMPLSLNKIQMIFDKSSNPIESLFPIVRYHENWTEFPQADVADILAIKARGHAILRGSQSNMYRDKIKEYPDYPAEDELMDLNPTAEKELREFIELCKQSSIKNILFICYPHIMSSKNFYDRQCRANRVAEILREEGMDYVDFDRMLDEIQLTKDDFFDDGHMLATGGRKFTLYLGNYIKENYDLTPRVQSEKSKSEWAESVDYMDRFYKYYDEYTKAHADDPYEKHEFKLRDRVRAIKALSTMEH